MGWLDDRRVEYLYRDSEGSEFTYEFGADETPPETIDGAKRICLLPYKLGGYTRVQFERNGRIGYEYRQSDGTKRIVSATREKYEHNMGNMGSKALKEAGTKKNESVYTKEFGKKVEKAEHQKAEKFVKNLRAAAKERK